MSAHAPTRSSVARWTLRRRRTQGTRCRERNRMCREKRLAAGGLARRVWRNRSPVARIFGVIADVASTWGGPVNLGVDSHVGGVMGDGAVTLRSRAQVDGRVVAGGTVTEQDGVVVVDGVTTFVRCRRAAGSRASSVSIHVKRRQALAGTFAGRACSGWAPSSTPCPPSPRMVKPARRS
jgi:hypothetical protein